MLKTAVNKPAWASEAILVKSTNFITAALQVGPQTFIICSRVVRIWYSTDFLSHDLSKILTRNSQPCTEPLWKLILDAQAHRIWPFYHEGATTWPKQLKYTIALLVSAVSPLNNVHLLASCFFSPPKKEHNFSEYFRMLIITRSVSGI